MFFIIYLWYGISMMKNHVFSFLNVDVALMQVQVEKELYLQKISKEVSQIRGMLE